MIGDESCVLLRVIKLFVSAPRNVTVHIMRLFFFRQNGLTNLTAFSTIIKIIPVLSPLSLSLSLSSLVSSHQPGDFLRIYNLRAIPGASKVPGLTSNQLEDQDHLAFHLHGGTAYGRGIRVLPQTSPDVQELQRYKQRQRLTQSAG